MNKILAATAAFVLILAIVGTAIAAGSATHTERVQFAKGATKAVIKGRLKDYSDVDYLVRTGARGEGI